MSSNSIHVGTRREMFTVIQIDTSGSLGRRPRHRVVCRCDCGKIRTYIPSHFVRVKSCGCLTSFLIIKRNWKHGKCNSPEYRSWGKARGRATCPTDRAAKNYSERGITMCKRWQDSFAAFFEDMGEKPSRKHSIDRIDNNGNYSCGKCDECIQKGWIKNCRWATASEQTKNTRKTRRITFGTKTMVLSDWAKELGICNATLATRLKMWPIEKALTVPKMH